MFSHVRRPVALLALPVLAACGGGDGTSGPPPVATVTVSALTQTVFVGQTLQLTVVATDAKGTVVSGQTPTFQSSAPEVASVTQTGSVTGVATGSAIITATVQGKTGTLPLT